MPRALSQSIFIGEFDSETGLVTGIGDWNDPLHWTLEEVPDATTEVRIGNIEEGGAIVTISVVPNAESAISYIGFEAGETGTVNVKNALKWTTSGGLNVGMLGTGFLNIEAGSQVINSTGVNIAAGAGGTGTVTVSGEKTGTDPVTDPDVPSLLQSSAQIKIGVGGAGELRIEGGGKVATTGSGTPGNINIGTGGESAGAGVVTVTGTGSLLQASNGIVLADGGVSGALHIENGGKAIGGGATNIAYAAGRTAELTVTGTGSTLVIGGNINVGNGQGTSVNVMSAILSVTNGGTVTQTGGSAGVIANAANSVGHATVDGEGSTWTMPVQFLIGNGATSTAALEVKNNGFVSASGNLVAGSGAASNVTITVESGGMLASTGVQIANGAGATATVTVTGAGSVFQNTLNFAVGNGLNTTGYLTISDSATVLTGGASTVAYGSGSTGTATVTGPDTLWESGADFRVGFSGVGTLNIEDGATVSASYFRFGASSGASGGILNLSGTVDGNGGDTRRGVLLTSYVAQGSGTYNSVFNFDGGIFRVSGASATDLLNGVRGGAFVREGGAFVDTNGFSRTLSQALQHGGTAEADGGLTKQGAGVLTLAGVNTYTGLTTVDEGELRVAGSLGSAATVKAASTLSGTGSILGAVTVENGGTLAPGLGLNAPGELEIGELTLTSGSALSLQIHGNLFDDNSSLLVNGAVNLTGGTLSLTGDLWALPEDMAEVRLFLLINNGVSAINGTFAGLAEGATVSFAGQDYQITYQANFMEADSPLNSLTGGNDVALLAVPASVPEPGSTGLLLGGVALLGGLRRRRKA